MEYKEGVLSFEEWGKEFEEIKKGRRPRESDQWAKALNLKELKRKAEGLVNSTCLGIPQIAEG